MLAIALFASSLAAPAGHYHPDDVGAASSLMAEASQSLSAGFEERSNQLRQLAAALRAYREGLELLGDRASSAEHDRLRALEKRYHREEAVLQGFADEVVGDFATAMKEALSRATAQWGELQRCRAEVPVGPRVPGMRQRTQPNPDCEGPSRNGEIAGAMDRDPSLRAAVDEIAARAWPPVSVSSEPQPPAGGSDTGWASLRDLVSATARGQLKQIDTQDDEMRMEIAAGLEEDEPDIAALEAREAEIEQITATARGALGRAIMSAAEQRYAKWKEPAPGWCANPVVLGGCAGVEVSRDAIARLTGDRKYQKLVAKSSP